MELCVSIFRLLHSLICCDWALHGALFSTAWTRPSTVYARFEGECACVMRPLSHRFVNYNTEKWSQMCEIHFVWSCPTWPSRWGMRISIDWPRLKSCQAVCDECTRGAICSGQSQDAGCFDMSRADLEGGAWGPTTLKFSQIRFFITILFIGA